MKRVLIADNELEIAQRIQDALRSEYQVDIVTSGLEVLEQYDSYDALILDVNFEYGMNGLEVAERIRKKNRDIGILFFSAYDYSDTVRQQALNIGAEFRIKPLNPNDIRQFIEGKDYRA